MLARDNKKFRSRGENWTHDPPNTISDVPTVLNRRVPSSILDQGLEISFVPGEHGFSSFQVENVHWKYMCAAH